MAHTIQTQTDNPANRLRDALEQAERQVVSLDGKNIEEFLMLLDSIEYMLEDFTEIEIDLRSEEVRWQSLLNRLSSRPGPVVAAASKAGGIGKLRAAHPPAESFWWHLDQVVSQNRRQSVQRVGLTLGAIVGTVLLAYWVLNTFFPPNPDTILLVDTTGRIEQLVMEQRWAEAIDFAEQTLQELPTEVELWAWEAVLLERLGDVDEAQEALDQALLLMEGRPEHLWLLVGNNRLQSGDLEGAEAAANRALEISPDEAQAYFLLAGVAEARGDVLAAIDLFNKTFDLAEADNPQLAVIAKVRMGQLLQSPPPLPTREDSPEPTAAPAP